VCYGILGTHDNIDEHNLPIVNPTNTKFILAKKILKTNGDYKFLIRINTEHKLYNPLSIYGREKSGQLLSNITRSNIEYREVNCRAFDFYLRFLSTKNIAWLYKAEREV
jgi:hypothetical protein